MYTSELRRKFNRFRILIIGRANAGKTTILQRVCKTQENPEIYNSAGEKIDLAVLMASRERGEHDIENEMVFRNNPGFVFHDSRGFEAGGKLQFEKVKAFIASRSKRRSLSDRIHVIWYCIPMDEDSRSFTAAEVDFFSRCDTGSVPVIVLFTKFDALYDDEFAELMSKGVSRKDAEALAPQHAKETFANGPQLKLLYNHKGNQRPPRCHICLPDMDKDGADCGPLIERTAETLDDNTLKQLFVSTQRTTLELCMRYAVERSLALHLDSTRIISSRIFGESNRQIIDELGKWFPQITITAEGDYRWARSKLRYRAERASWLTYRSWAYSNTYTYYFGDEEMWSALRLSSSESSTLEKIVQLGSAAVIIFENVFHLQERQRYQQEPVHPLRVALQQYMASPNAAAVREALSSAIHTYEAGFFRWIPGSAKRSQKKADLIQAITEVILQHRLPIPEVQATRIAVS
jgi:GTP-binding protein EngB required for normal cell division